MVLKQKFLIADANGKLLVQHIIPATYKNPFFHLSLSGVLSSRLFPAKRRQELAKVFVWGNNWSAGYYHFVAEDLPKLLYMQAESVPFYTWPSKSPKWREEIFALFGVSSNIITKPFSVNEACYIVNNRTKKPGINFSVIHPELVEVLIDRVDQLVTNWNMTEATKITWISRKHTHDRNILNEDECIDALKNAGTPVEILYPEQLSVKQQIAMVYHTSWIIGPHGAGLTNIIFSSKAGLIEIGPTTPINNSFISLAKSFNRQYEYFPVKSTGRLKNRANLFIESPVDFAKHIQQIIGT